MKNKIIFNITLTNINFFNIILIKKMFHKKKNKFYTIGNLKLEEGKIIKRSYNQLNIGSNNLAKDHYLLTNAFNVTKLIKNKMAKNIDLEEKKQKLKLNIYNYKNSFELLKNNKYTTKESELLKALLIKIDEKNFEELLREREKQIHFKKRTLKGIYLNNEPLTFTNSVWTTFNKTNSNKSINKLIKKSYSKTKESFNFNNISKITKTNKSISLDIKPNGAKESKDNKFYMNYSFHKNSHILSKKLQRIFSKIDAEEKKVEKNSNILNIMYNNNYYKTHKSSKKNLKSNSINNAFYSNENNFIKSISKIKFKKDIDKLLFENNKNIFNGIRNKLISLYKTGQRMPKEEYLDK